MLITETPDQAPTAPALTPAQLAEARDWIADCFDDVDAGTLTDAQVTQGIARHYAGGLEAFRAACAPLAAEVAPVTAATARKALDDLLAANVCPTCHAWTGNARQCAECIATIGPQCRICGKVAARRHDAATRNAHHDHMARFGWSGMCAAPQH